MATKAELEKQVKLLKDEVRKLRGEAKSVEAELTDLNSEAHGMIVQDGLFKLATLKFNHETNKAAIEDIRVIGTGKSLTEASSYAKRAIVDSLVEVNKER